jgi:hypothetical protein
MADVEALVTETDKRLSIHEAVCAQRYENIESAFENGRKRMQKIEYILYVIAAAVLLGPGVAAELIKKLFGV